MSISGASAELPAITAPPKRFGLGYTKPKIHCDKRLGEGVSGCVWSGFITPPPEESSDGIASPIEPKRCVVKLYDRHEARDSKTERRVYHLLELGGQHPNFLEFYHEGNSPRSHLVLSMFEGQDLYRAHVQPDSPFASLYRIADIAEQLLSAGKFLKEIQVLHGDLKPANILINREGVIKVMDFGNSHILTEGLCKRGLCSPNYASPESKLGIEHGAEADLWSIAIILYELVTKKNLFSISASHTMRKESLKAQIAECEAEIAEINDTINARHELETCLDRGRRVELLEKKESYLKDPVKFIDRLREAEDQEKELEEELEKMMSYRDLETKRAYLKLHRLFIGKEAPEACQRLPAYPRSPFKIDWEGLKPDLKANMLIEYPDLGKNGFDLELDKKFLAVIDSVLKGAIRWQAEREEIERISAAVNREMAFLRDECRKLGSLTLA